ncbi:hypothetical protein [Rahnella sp. PCH160]|uniref:hypothetical protein n=1 Tax=Rahnella sp. PCH160 TaxID=3447928 RepID=UPI0039FCD0AE
MQFGANLLLPALVLSLAGCATRPLPPTHQTMRSTEIRSDNGSQMMHILAYREHSFWQNVNALSGFA